MIEGGNDMDDLELVHLLSHAYDVYRRIYLSLFEQQEADQGLATRGYGKLLHRLADQGPLTQSQLAERLQVRPQSLTTALDRLETGGYVKRRRGSDDRREQLVSITPAGRQLGQRLHAIRAQAAGRLLCGLDADERQDLGRLLLALQQADHD